MEGVQTLHASPIHQHEPTMGGTIDILQQIAQALQRAAQPVAAAPKRFAIERMARYRPIDFMGKKDEKPAMAENWLQRTERMLVQMLVSDIKPVCNQSFCFWNLS